MRPIVIIQPNNCSTVSRLFHWHLLKSLYHRLLPEASVLTHMAEWHAEPILSGTHHRKVAQVLASLAAAIRGVLDQPGALLLPAVCRGLAGVQRPVTRRRAQSCLEQIPPLANLYVPVGAQGAGMIKLVLCE